jgi:hypothetical protein
VCRVSPDSTLKQMKSVPVDATQPDAVEVFIKPFLTTAFFIHLRSYQNSTPSDHVCDHYHPPSPAIGFILSCCYRYALMCFRSAYWTSLSLFSRDALLPAGATSEPQSQPQPKSRPKRVASLRSLGRREDERPSLCCSQLPRSCE